MRKLLTIIFIFCSAVLLANAEPVKRFLLCMWKADVDNKVRPQIVEGIASISDVTVICSSNQTASGDWWYYFCADNPSQLSSKMNNSKRNEILGKIEPASTNKVQILLTDNPAQDLESWMKNH